MIDRRPRRSLKLVSIGVAWVDPWAVEAIDYGGVDLCILTMRSGVRITVNVSAEEAANLIDEGRFFIE